MPPGLQLTAPREMQIDVYVVYYDPPLQSGEVRTRAILSGISQGTEMNLFSGNNPFVEKEFDKELRLFVNRKETLSGSIHRPGQSTPGWILTRTRKISGTNRWSFTGGV
jgi:hypothetical protein